ncbi:MAG: phospho-sugar mutase [Propionibacteriaceae bacterium]|jgi:phosphomannomutase|nr:phospho-sugar mutase [Propionibacteriaceae bacterium]
MSDADIKAWLAADPDPVTRAELARLVEAAEEDPAAAADLADRFAGTLQFGTAGLRGSMGAGPNRMNRAVVIRAAKGLIDFLAESLAGQGAPPRVVIGNDARHHSRQFAIDSAAVVAAAGGEAILLPDPVPTPVLSYAVRALDADAGVMVTASHNPAKDNGYKVYLGGRCVGDPERGAQIVPPYDAQIAAKIAAAPPANEVERVESGWRDLGQDFVDGYTSAIAVGDAPAAAIRVVHTAMHGVGSSVALSALAQAGFDDVVAVAAQRDPDPDFPTVSFPNPEEPGAIDMALALAAEVAADVVVANDPDADRCAVAVNDPRSGWRMLHGDELGAVLGEDIACELAAGAGEGSPGVLVNSVVSSRLLSRIAEHHRLPHRTTLTGFKWMGRVPGMAFAYEEAIGYCVRPDIVHDKDGLSTAVRVARLVARLKAEGRSVVDLLDDLARRHGLYLTSQLSARFSDLAQIPATMARLRAQPPQSLAGSPVSELADLGEGWNGLPPTDGMLLATAADDRVIVRPSGTEPKVKCYLEVVAPVSASAGFEDLTAAREQAKARLERIKQDLGPVLA